jgi:hypothetical protein
MNYAVECVFTTFTEQPKISNLSLILTRISALIQRQAEPEELNEVGNASHDAAVDIIFNGLSSEEGSK